MRPDRDVESDLIAHVKNESQYALVRAVEKDSPLSRTRHYAYGGVVAGVVGLVIAVTFASLGFPPATILLAYFLSQLTGVPLGACLSYLASQRRLEDLVRREQLRDVLASVPPEQRAMYMATADPEWLVAFASDPRTETALLAVLATNENPSVVIAVALNASTSWQALACLANSQDPRIRAAANETMRVVMDRHFADHRGIKRELRDCRMDLEDATVAVRKADSDYVTLSEAMKSANDAKALFALARTLAALETRHSSAIDRLENRLASFARTETAWCEGSRRFVVTRPDAAEQDIVPETRELLTEGRKAADEARVVGAQIAISRALAIDAAARAGILEVQSGVVRPTPALMGLMEVEEATVQQLSDELQRAKAASTAAMAEQEQSQKEACDARHETELSRRDAENLRTQVRDLQERAAEDRRRADEERRRSESARLRQIRLLSGQNDHYKDQLKILEPFARKAQEADAAREFQDEILSMGQGLLDELRTASKRVRQAIEAGQTLVAKMNDGALKSLTKTTFGTFLEASERRLPAIAKHVEHLECLLEEHRQAPTEEVENRLIDALPPCDGAKTELSALLASVEARSRTHEERLERQNSAQHRQDSLELE